MISRRKRRRSEDELVLRAARAEKSAQLGELSAARQALEGDAVAPGTLRTLASLTNPERRPPLPREPLPNELSTFEPVAPFRLDAEQVHQKHSQCKAGGRRWAIGDDHGTLTADDGQHERHGTTLSPWWHHGKRGSSSPC